eukprot:TRINITY_DN29693_c0_g1_i1.p4 TRINITY_DN29693_c0_g1~~TRINITY_DN29693_c0_g1_i1.p4  ORF type:complete len:126 (-),score=7.75 TRINITY_DN29693_c0_g1_i1:44-421(-)
MCIRDSCRGSSTIPATDETMHAGSTPFPAPLLALVSLWLLFERTAPPVASSSVWRRRDDPTGMLSPSSGRARSATRQILLVRTSGIRHAWALRRHMSPQAVSSLAPNQFAKSRSHERQESVPAID